MAAVLDTTEPALMQKPNDLFGQYFVDISHHSFYDVSDKLLFQTS